MLKRNYFFIEQKSSFLETVNACKEKLQAEYGVHTIVGISAFIHASDETDFWKKQEVFQRFFNQSFPHLPVSVVAQSPGEGIALEIWTHNSCRNLKHNRLCGMNYTTYEDAFGKSILSFGLSTPDSSLSFREQAYYSFEVMHAILAAEGFSMDDLIRQWNYIPQILKTTAENNRIYQNYQLFNDIRQYYYGIYKRNSLYPAATGIGMDYGAVTIDFYAVKKTDGVRIAGLNNPNQTNAYHYGQEVLVGSPLKESESKKAPLFERAKYIGTTDKGCVFISGTAAITGEQTVGLGDVVRQTIITATNISDLISPENLKPVCDTLQEKNYTYLRVYVKNIKQLNVVRRVCETQYKEVPILYVKADICRGDLLVEMEGESEILPLIFLNTQ